MNLNALSQIIIIVDCRVAIRSVSTDLMNEAHLKEISLDVMQLLGRH